jgi:voltage-gated potassium channel
LITHVVRRFLDTTYRAITDLHWSVLALIVLTHASVSWMALSWMGETGLRPLDEFVYWYATTAYTVGYGDLSPTTHLGRLFTALFVFPGAIAAFTTAVAKLVGDAAERFRRRRTGKGDYSRMDSGIVLIGYNADRTPKLIDELLADAGHDQLVLMTRKALEDPDPRVRFVKAQSLTSADDLRRAGVETARSIAIYADSDAETLTAALAATSLARQAHVVCWFEAAETAGLLRQHCPQVECIVAAGPEMVSRSVRDPGASQVISALTSNLDRGATLYAMAWPQPETGFRVAAEAFLQQGATLLAVQGQNDNSPTFNPGHTRPVRQGDRLYYVASQRLSPTSMAAG